MGLGKTLQVIGDHHIDLCYHFIIFNFCYMTTCKLGCAALFCHLYEMGISGPFLVVAPLSTIPNWLNEFKRFAPKVFLCNQSWESGSVGSVSFWAFCGSGSESESFRHQAKKSSEKP
jgi:SNF2 family DNA or RNA helicase